MVKLRDYQKKAIQSFYMSDGCGIFEMATGTGKTYTALSISRELYEKDKRQFLVIIVPFIHLVDQWTKQFSLFDIGSFIGIYGSKQRWLPRLSRDIILYNHGMKKRVVIIGSYKSVGSKECQELLSTITSKQFLIADECHYIGSPTFREHRMNHFDYKLGLSATPKRWWDDLGTAQIVHLFGQVVFEFPLERAIKEMYLTPYYYYPEMIALTLDEELMYAELTKKIGTLMAQKETLTIEGLKSLDHLLLKRSRILKLAENKKERLKELLLSRDNHKHTIIYCGEGEVESTLELVRSLNITTKRFDSTVSMKKREKLLEEFDTGDVDILVAIRCLDEGVDIPSTKIAFFLASTTNPREFIQRRGRVLRQSVGKKHAIIFDFIVFPFTENDRLLRSIAGKEMPRFAEFSKYALNEFEARKKVRPYLTSSHLEGYLDILPWEMYDIVNNSKMGEKFL